MTRMCTKCKEIKLLYCFGKDKYAPDGVMRHCRECMNAKTRINYKWNGDNVRAGRKRYYANNREKVAALNKSWRGANNRKLALEDVAFTPRFRQATPKWLTKEQKQEIMRVYDHAKDCRIITGENYHVDHIEPLNGEASCGLHVPWNLQVVPDWYNIMKGKRLDFGAK